jgi:hypothetical protein
MNQTTKQQTKRNKKSIIAVTVIVLTTSTVILATGTSQVSSILDVKAKNRYALDLPVKTENASMIQPRAHHARIIRIVNSR